MKKIAFALAAVAVLLFAHPGTAVSGHGGGKGGAGFKFGGHGFHAMNHKGQWWKNNNNNWWYAMNNGQIWWQNNKWWYAGYGGYGGVYATQPAVTETVAVPVPVPVAVEASPPCQRVQQPMTVRSEDGGERVVSVTRCQN